MYHPLRTIALIATALGGALVAGPAFTQGTGTTTARYTMDAGTISGMAAMGQSGRSGLGAAIGMLRDGGASAKDYELQLKLGTTRATAGSPEAEHTLPRTARFGPALPLWTPPPGKGAPDSYTPPEIPRGRLLLFWGCGEKAGSGQPVVIDFAKLARGQVPPGLYAQPLQIAEEWRIRQQAYRSYGEWPNPDDTKPIPANASLLGAHKVTGNYTPEIAFTLDQDFMAPIRLSNRAQPTGAHALTWTAVPAATGYYAWAFSASGQPGGGGRGGGTGDIVWWTSSAVQAFGGPMWDWLSPAAVTRLIGGRTVMPPSQTSCTIPAEVRKAGGGMTMASLYAYGPERNFAFPSRPANARAGWQPDWIARARFRSMTMAMLGMDMSAMGDANSSGEDADSAPPPPTKPKCRGGLAGLAQRAAGLCQ